MTTKNYLALLLCGVLIWGLTVVGFAEEYQQSPMLEEMVQSGELPELEDRLPEVPFEVGPGTLVQKEHLDWQAGKYGGTLETVHSSAEWNPDVFVLNVEPILTAPAWVSERVEPNIVRDYEVSEDNKVFTFYMREGLKWSDGFPVTTEDVRFAYEDVMLNDKLTPVISNTYRAGCKPSAEPMNLEIIDDYTFKISFTEPFGDFVYYLARKKYSGYTDLIKPKHYLKKFHIKYTSLEALEPYLEAEELNDEWWELFSIKEALHWDLTRRNAIGFPVLNPWQRVEGPSGQIVMERNPYYYKVDIEGKQLPYIDKIVSDYVSDTQIANMRVLNGEVDFLREDTGLNKLPLYKNYEDKGGYRTVLLDNTVTPTMLEINYTYDDSVWQEVVRDKRFRTALNLAIDREEIIESVYYGLYNKPKTIPSEYNPEKAKELLDEMGLDKKDNEGYRIGPDGKTFEFRLELADHAPDLIPVAELLVEHFRDIDIKATMKTISTTLWGTRAGANEIMATVFWVNAETRPYVWDDYLPGNSRWGIPWKQWYDTNGESGIEPPAWIKEVFNLHEDIMKAAPMSAERKNAIEALNSWYYEYYPELNIVEGGKHPVIVSQDLGNVPHAGRDQDTNFAGEQFFFKN